MLRFQSNPDKIFTEILEAAFKFIIDEIKEISSDELEIFLPKRKGFKVWSIDFDALIDIYFFDTDFLMNPEIFVNLSREHKDQLGFSKEIFGITTGMKLHPDELKIELCEEGEFTPEDPDPSCFRTGSREYPDFNLIEVE